jgi:serine/threonine protein kinase
MSISLGAIVNRVYLVQEKIGSGGFGTVYKGVNTKTQKEVAIKIEYALSEIRILKHESTIINHLYKHGCRSIPCIYWYGLHESIYTCLVMQHYVCSLHDYAISKKISPYVLCEIMAKCIEILKTIHDAWVVHRDIKPQNFMIGADKEIYLIDFGMATFYVDEYRNPISNTEPKQYIVGSPRYASYFVHCGMSPERRDDLISLGYMYIFLKHPGLTWDDLRLQNNSSLCTNSSNEISELDINHPKNIERKFKKQLNHFIPEIQRISYNEDCVSVIKYMEYCYRLSNTTTPMYNSLVSLFSPSDSTTYKYKNH